MTHIPRAVCANDSREMIIAETGSLIQMDASWGPYYKIYADRYSCPECDSSVFLPAGQVAAEHFEDAFDRLRPVATARFADA